MAAAQREGLGLCCGARQHGLRKGCCFPPQGPLELPGFSGIHWLGLPCCSWQRMGGKEGQGVLSLAGYGPESDRGSWQ